MRKALRNYFLTLAGMCLLCIMMGCSIKENEVSEVSPEPTVKEETRQEELLELPQGIQDIIYGDGEFYDVARGQTYTKKSYQVDVKDEKDGNKKKVYWKEYIVLDMDKDGEQELLVRLQNENSSETANTIFDVQQNQVYCYSYRFRAITNVYKDGVFHGSSGAADSQLYYLSFKKEKATETIIAETKSAANSNDTDYFVKNKKVSYEKFWEFVQKYYADEKEWISF